MEIICCSLLKLVLSVFLVIACVPLILILLPAVISHITPSGRRKRKLINLIPGPPIKPIIGNLAGFFLSRKRILEYRNENCQKYYPVYRLWYFQMALINVVGPEYVEAILHSSKHIDKGWVYKFLQPWLGEGLLTSGGEKWFSHRKILTPTFHFKILEEFVPLFLERSADLADKLSIEAASGEAFDIVPVISQCTLEIICESAMGIKLDAKDESQKEYMMAIKEYGEVFYNRIAKPWYGIDFLFKLTPLYKKQQRVLRILHSFTQKVIKEKKEEYLKKKANAELQDPSVEKDNKKKKVKAFLELLIELSEEKNALTDQEIREEVDTFTFEGHDTTSMAISWTMFMLANKPEMQEQVWNEIDAKFKEYAQLEDDGSNDSKAKLYNELHLLERFIKETLRMFPSVPFISRELKEDFKMEQYVIPKGVMVNVVISGIHKHPILFPDPEKFDPDRFLPEAVKERHPYAYVPFSAGPRNCIGQRFAMLEVKSVICSLLRSYKLVAVDKPEDITFMHDMVLRPCNGIKMKLERRT